MADLREELQQRRPFGSPQEEAFLNVARTDAVLRAAVERLLEPHGVSIAQYNVLRILRGAGPDGLCRNEIRDRLITRMPDVTRLLDRMAAAGMITRDRGEEDRRQVRTRLTEHGRALVDSLDAPVAAEHHRLLGHLDDGQLRTLNQLLVAARNRG